VTSVPRVDESLCRTAQPVFEFVGRRWVAALLLAGSSGARRFSEYRTATGISDRLLTQRLRELEQHGMIERIVVPTMPVQISYEPTERGTELVKAMQPLVRWGRSLDADAAAELSA
jgi:DNA-binding HxlR family transcriptional regulator